MIPSSTPECFKLFHQSASAALQARGWHFPGGVLYLVNACLNLYGVKTRITGQCIQVGVGITGKPMTGAPILAIEFPEGEVFNANGVQGWPAIWDEHQKAKGLGEVDRTKLRDVSSASLTRFHQQLADPGRIDALAPVLLASIQEASLRSDTPSPPSKSHPGARL